MTIQFTVIADLKRNNKGSTVVLLSVLVLSAILTIVLASSEVLSNGVMEDKLQLDSTKAYFAAEAGAERVLYEVRNTSLTCNNDECVAFGSPSSCGNCSNADKTQTLSANSTTYKVKYNLDGLVNVFSSTGKYH